MTAKAWIVAAALTLTSGAAGLAQDSTTEEQPPALEQPTAEETSPEAKPAAPPQLAQYLEDGRSARELSDNELAVRIRRGKALLKWTSISAEQRAEIGKRVARAEAEIGRRTAQSEPEQQPAGDQPPPEDKKAEQPAEQPAAADLPPEVAEFLADIRPSRSLSDTDLQNRAKRARALIGREALPGEARIELRRRLARAQAELDRRGAATAEPPAEQPESPPAAQPGEPPRADMAVLADKRPANTLNDDELKARIAVADRVMRGDYAQQWRRAARRLLDADRAEQQRRAEAPASPGAPDAADQKLLADTRPAKDLSDDELKTRLAAAERVVRGDYGLQWRRAARRLLDADKAEQQRRAEAPAGPGAPNAADRKLLADTRPAKDLSDDELKARLAAAERVVRGDYSLQWRRGARKVFDADGAELQRRTQTAAKPPADPNLDGNRVSEAAEAQAREFLAGGDRVQSLSDDQLSQRLAAMRDLLQRNELSPRTERALRQRLGEEREVLRTRIARREAEQEEAQAPRTPGRKRKIDFDTNITIVLGDRRRSDELEDEELRRRIDVYRDAIDDEDYSAEERDYWRRTVTEDRRALRARLLREREERARDYRRRRANNDDFDIEFDEAAPRRPSVWAAEADDEDIEDALVAAPRRKVERRYTIDDIERNEEVRAQMPALEIDTVRFGFNEAFLREEEIGRLERIAGVIEKILAARPNEVFLIEGHTDAVGSDAYNLDLSRKRARAVREALTAYYVIPAESLETAGYGERYLKIPTSEPEPENRRVSLRRVTPLVGER